MSASKAAKSKKAKKRIWIPNTSPELVVTPEKAVRLADLWHTEVKGGIHAIAGNMTLARFFREVVHPHACSLVPFEKQGLIKRVKKSGSKKRQYKAGPQLLKYYSNGNRPTESSDSVVVIDREIAKLRKRLAKLEEARDVLSEN